MSVKTSRKAKKGTRRKARATCDTRYAEARAAANLTYRDLMQQGFGCCTVRNADRGILPKLPRNRAAYLLAIRAVEPV